METLTFYDLNDSEMLLALGSEGSDAERMQLALLRIRVQCCDDPGKLHEDDPNIVLSKGELFKIVDLAFNIAQSSISTDTEGAWAHTCKNSEEYFTKILTFDHETDDGCYQEMTVEQFKAMLDRYNDLIQLGYFNPRVAAQFIYDKLILTLAHDSRLISALKLYGANRNFT